MAEYKMNILDIVWLSGLLEGEGSFGLYLDKTGRGNRKRAQLQFSTSDYDVATHVAQLLNREKITVTEPPERVRSIADNKTMYKVQMKGNPAVEIMRKIHPYMFGRRSAKIQEIISYYENRGNDRYVSPNFFQKLEKEHEV